MRGQGHADDGGGRRAKGRLRAAVAVVALLVSGPAWGGGLVGGSYQLLWDQKVTFTGPDKVETRDVKHTLEVTYIGFLSPIIENEVKIKVERQSVSGEDPVLKITPEIKLKYKGSYWNAGAKRLIDDSSEEGRSTKTTDAYFVELYFAPPRTTAPDLKAKYTLDKDFEPGAIDSTRHGISLSTVHSPSQDVYLSGDYSRNLTRDGLSADSDTEEETFNATARLKRTFSDKLRANTEYKVEVSKSATLLDSGGAKSPKDEQTDTWKNIVQFRPFKPTELEATYDYVIRMDKMTNEHTQTANGRVGLIQTVGRFITLKGDLSHGDTRSVHTADDNKKIENTRTAEVKFRLSKVADFTARYQDKKTDEDHVADAKDTTSGTVNRTVTWTGILASFWTASASLDRADTITNHRTTAIETKYALKSPFVFNETRLAIDPSYDISLKKDFQAVPVEATETRDLKLKIAWKIISTRKLDVKADHTFGRKRDTSAKNIVRTDNSTGTATWKAPVTGWTLGFDVTRAATDTSGDDEGPEISSTYTFKSDFLYRGAMLNISYKFDKKTMGDEVLTLDHKVGWTAPHWDVALSYSINKTYSAVRNEGYSINLTFKYNL